MDKAQFIALYDQDQRIDATFPGMRREQTPNVVRHVDTSAAREGMVLFSRLADANAEEVIQEQVSYFESIGQAFEWKVYDYDRPASAAWIYFSKNSPFASLWGGATLESFRKQGLYSALLAVRAQEAKARQVRYLTVDASPMSRPILEKSGFEFIANTYPCKWKPKPLGLRRGA